MTTTISSKLLSRRLFVAGGAAALVVGGAGLHAAARQATPVTEWGDFDLMFIDMMIPHHESAIAMAEVALERSERPELTQLAEQIIAGQSAENEQMRAWREAWYPGAAPTAWEQMMPGNGGMMMHGMSDMPHMAAMGMMGMGMMQPDATRAALRTAEPFEPAFIDAMIPHHLMALMMTEMAHQRATHPELIALATAMFDTQTAEITLMRRWR